MLPESLKNLTEAFKYLPGIGEKTAERLTFAVLELDEEQVDFFAESLVDVFKNIKKCRFVIHLLKMIFTVQQISYYLQLYQSYIGIIISLIDL